MPDLQKVQFVVFFVIFGCKGGVDGGVDGHRKTCMGGAGGGRLEETPHNTQKGD